MKYPNYIMIDGVRYDINTDYRVALRCFEIIDDPDISDYERAAAITYLLFTSIPDDKEVMNRMIEMAGKYLRCGTDEEEQTSHTRDMDLIQDESYIYASFMSDYHIDLSQTSMHWWMYIELLQGLTENCALSRVREIRNYDLSELKDSKSRSKMANAQKMVALKVRKTKKELEMEKEFNDLFGG